MRAYEIREATGIDALTLTERPEPALGPHQALIKMQAASLNYRDLLVVKGSYSRHLPLPLVPLSDGVGEVVRVGDAVTRVRVGDRVAGAFMQGWVDGQVTDAAAKTALGAAIDGVLAELVALDESGLVHIPEHLSFEEAATLPCAGVTAWHALVEAGHVGPGQTILTLGSGGVSVFALQFASAHGARVIATSSSDQKLERLRRLGAAEVINYATTPDWDKRARALTGGIGVDHVIEVGGAGTLARSLRAVRMAGRISLIGVLANGSSDLNVTPILMRNITVQGIFVGSRAMFERMNRFMSDRRLRPVVDRVFPFEETPDAYRLMEQRGHFGKIVIRIA